MGHSGKKFTTKDNSNNTPFLFYDSKQLGVTHYHFCGELFPAMPCPTLS
jgi:hypothetical protein